MLLKNGTVYRDGAFTKSDVYISGELFAEEICGEVLECTGLYVLPGFIDIHTHGAMGFDVLDGTTEAIGAIAEYMLKRGVTAFLPTVMTAPFEVMENAVKTVSQFKGTELHADMPGVYMEGPYFSTKRTGAQNPAYVRDVSLTEFEELLDLGAIKVISIAPELPGSIEFIDKYSGKAKFAAGHTDADYSEMELAKKHGVTVLTHTFNGMRGIHHRNPGAVGASLESGVYCEFICDGLHLDPTVIRLLFKMCPERLVMISDSIRPAGLPDGRYSSGGLDVTLSGGIAKLDSGTIAGSACNLLDGIRNMVRFGIGLAEAVRTATENPAKAAGIFDMYGSITAKKYANAILLDKSLQLKYVIHRGKCVHKF